MILRKLSNLSSLNKNLGLSLFVLSLFIPLKTIGSELPKSLKDLETLETRVFTDYDDYLPEIESSVVLEIQKDPYSAYAHYLLTYVYLRLYSQNTKEAELAKKADSSAQQAMLLEPKSEFGYLAMSDVYQSLGFQEQAWAYLKMIKSPSWRAMYRLIKFQYEPVSSFKAYKALEFCALEHPESRGILVPLILNVMKNFNEETLSASLKKLNKEFDHPLLKQELAVYDIAKGKLAEAENIFDSLKPSYNKFPEIALNYGNLLLTEFHKKNKAYKIEQETLQIKALPKIIYDRISLQIALMHLDKMETNLFFQKAAHVLENSSDPLSTMEVLALAIAQQNPENLSPYMSRLSSKIHVNSDFYAMLGRLYAENLGDQIEAIHNFTKALVLEPGNFAYYDSIGVSYFRLNQFKSALGAFTKATKLNPEDSVAFYNMACVYSREGRQDLAWSSLKHAIQLDPSLEITARDDSDLAALKKLSSFKMLTSPNEEILKPASSNQD